MKLQELFENRDLNKSEQLNEFTRPYGIGSQLKDKAVGSLKGIFGGGQGEAGNQVSGQLANRLFKDFKHYVGTQGQSGQSHIDKQLLIDYLNGRGFNPALANGLLDTITPKEAADVLMQAARTKRQMGQTKTFDQGESSSDELSYNNQKLASTSRANKTQPKDADYSEIMQALRSLSTQEKADLVNLLRLTQGK